MAAQRQTAQTHSCTITSCANHWTGLISPASCFLAHLDCLLLLSAATMRSTTPSRCAARLR